MTKQQHLCFSAIDFFPYLLKVSFYWFILSCCSSSQFVTCIISPANSDVLVCVCPSPTSMVYRCSSGDILIAEAL